MRIAILTLPLHTNYGGILQCYALQTALERMGHEVSVLNTNFVNVDYKTRMGLFIKRLIKTVLRKESRFYGWKTEREIICQNIQPFIDKYIRLRNIKDFSLLNEDEFDAIVVGSDQIWRPLYYYQFYCQPITDAYLGFAKDWTHIKRVAYATSFGTDEWEYTPQETKECALLLKMFDAVSVRELSGIDLCRVHLGMKATWVLDPTLLLTKDAYLALITQSDLKTQNRGLFYYILDVTPEKISLINRLADERGWKHYQENNLNIDCSSLYYYGKQIPKSIERWIAGFRDASFIVTDSFHGCVFSILFNKPFVVIANTERGLARLKSLLSIFGMNDRLVNSSNGVDFSYIHDIRWDKVNDVLNKHRQDSLSFLSKALNKQ